MSALWLFTSCFSASVKRNNGMILALSRRLESVDHSAEPTASRWTSPLTKRSSEEECSISPKISSFGPGQYLLCFLPSVIAAAHNCCYHRNTLLSSSKSTVMDEIKKTAYEHTAPVEAGNDEEKAFSDPHWRTGSVARFSWLGNSATTPRLFGIKLTYSRSRGSRHNSALRSQCHHRA